MSKQLTIKNHAEEHHIFKQRVVIACVIMGALSIGLCSRLVYLQCYRHQWYNTLSNDNRVNVVPTPPPRGLIYDRNGILLADNIPSYSLELIPEQVKYLSRTIAELSTILPISAADIAFFNRMKTQKRRFNRIPLRMRLTEQEMAVFSVNRHRFPALHIAARLARHYPLGNTTAHLLGYVGRINERELDTIDSANYSATQFIGKIGIERAYERQLHGQVGHQQVEIDARGRTLRVLNASPPTPGTNLYLTIDSRLQAAAQRLLTSHRGAVVALQPNTGAILAMVSHPSYDPNAFTHGIDKQHFQQLQQDSQRPLFNRALRGQYPPASTIKPVIGLFGLEHRLITPDQRIDDPGYFQLENDEHRYRDWKIGGHGPLNLHEAIVQSCGTYFYKLSHELNITRLAKGLRAFGLGQSTGIELKEERHGIVPDPQWKRRTHHLPWYPGETLITGIGHGFLLATPLQMAQMAAVIATHGKRWQAHLIDRAKTNGHWTVTQPTLLSEVVTRDPTHWDTIIDAMIGVVSDVRGTAHRISKRLTYSMAGKTGTAQVFTIKQNETYEHDKIPEQLRDHYWFIAFAPVQKPQIALAVIIENHSGASLVARRLLDFYFKASPHHALS